MPRKLTDEERADIEEVFYLYDDDESGSISTDELPTLLRYLGFNPTQAQCKELISKYDKNNDKTLDFKEFISLCETEDVPSTDSDDDLRAAFKVFDKDGSGYLTFEELKQALMTRGEAMTDAEVTRMLKGVDDGDGQLNFEEFVALMKGESSSKPAAEEPVAAPAAEEKKEEEAAPAAEEKKEEEAAPAAEEKKEEEAAPAAEEKKDE